jgi:arginine-tRNA-protein transferase
VKSSVNLGFPCSSLPVALYQRLIDDGWRRSGHHIYRPVLEKTCCALQSIRLHAFRFQMSRSQRHALVKFLGVVKSDLEVSTVSREDLLDTVCAAVFSNELPCRLSVQLVNFDGSAENFELFKKYQIAVHHENEDEISLNHFENFLVNSPLRQRLDTAEGLIGSWHTEYRIDGKLIAVGVIDILPSGVSSVYCY